MTERPSGLATRATRKTVWIPLKDAARVAGVSERTVRRWIANEYVISRIYRGRVQVDHSSLTAGIFRNDWRAQARVCLSKDVESFAVSQWTRMIERALAAREGDALPVDAIRLLNAIDADQGDGRIGDLECGKIARIAQQVRSDYFETVTNAIEGAPENRLMLDLLRDLACFFGCAGLDARLP